MAQAFRQYVIRKGSESLDSLQVREAAYPPPAPHQVVVRMRAASLNSRDLAILSGRYIFGPLERDTVPLSDGAGEVVEVGAGVKDFALGDRVVATFLQEDPAGALGGPLDGCLTEYATFSSSGLLKVPDHLSFEEAAALPCAGVTAWNALMHGPRSVRPGDTVLVLGTGGVALFGLQFAKMAGARVIVTSSSDAKLGRARALGADDCVNYTNEPDWEKAVLHITGGQGADHIVETGGAGTLPRSYRALARDGIISFIGAMTRPDGDSAPYPLMTKNGVLRGIGVGSKEQLRSALRAMAVKGARPMVDRIFKFDEAPQAFQHLKSGVHMGKVVIEL